MIQNSNHTGKFPTPQQSNMGEGNTTTVNPQPQPPNQLALQNPTQFQQPTRELQAASLCRFGQENVQEIISRIQEIFTTLRAAQPPDGRINMGMDRKPKVQETLKHVKQLFKRLRVIYDKIEDSSPSTDEIDDDLESSIPFKDQPTMPIDDKKNTEVYLAAQEEYRELVEQVILKNRQLRETMDQLRLIIWDVNTMLAMRKE